MHMTPDELLSLALGELPAGRAAEVRAHVEACGECARELAWARAERALIARRPAPGTARLWEGVAARLEAPRPLALRRRRWVLPGFAAAAAAAALFLALRPAAQAPVEAEETDSVDPRALAALDKAERDYRNAAAILEKEYEAARPRLEARAAQRWDASLQRERAQLGGASALAAGDPSARLHVLDGYAGYLKSLQEVIEQSEEAGP